LHPNPNPNPNATCLTSQASAAAAVAAGCVAAAPAADDAERPALPPLDNLLADDEPFPANCASRLEEVRVRVRFRNRVG